MCETCDNDAVRVSAATGVRLATVKKVQAGFKALFMSETAVPMTDAEVAQEGMDAMQEDEGLDILPLLIGPYPFVLIRLVPVPGRSDGAMALAMHAEGIERKNTIEVLEATLLSAKSPETGGVTESGVIVSPGVQRGSMRDE